MRQAGILAAAGILALEKGPKRLVEDHKFTKMLAVTAKEAGEGVVDVDLDEVETNMVMLKVKPSSGTTPSALVARLAKSTDEEIQALGGDIRLLSYAMTAVNIRIVVHCNLTAEDIEQAQRKLRYVLNEQRQKIVPNGH